MDSKYNQRKNQYEFLVSVLERKFDDDEMDFLKEHLGLYATLCWCGGYDAAVKDLEEEAGSIYD